MRDAPRGRADRAPSLWMAMISAGLPCRRADSAERLRHHLLAAERDDQHRADVRMPAVGRQRVVGHAHVGAELAAAGQVRQRRAERRAAAAIRSATTAAQITVGTTRT